jgi:hypothetical protein
MGNNIKKLIVRLSRSQNDVSFDDLAKILVYIGYELSKHRGKGSHRIFQKQGCDHVNIPFAKPINKHYVKKVLELYYEERGEED